MPLQNRVSPFGEIIANPARGMFMGNRGILHVGSTRQLHPTRRWAHKAWICCLCDFKGRRRDLMVSGTYTELFFLDEATALAAGHRPCFECRREDALRFQAAWAEGNAVDPPKAGQMDDILHAERLEGRQKRLHPLDGPAAAIPNGTMVTDGVNAFLSQDGQLRSWAFSGYGAAIATPRSLRLLTPPSISRALSAGYRPRLHVSATGN